MSRPAAERRRRATCSASSVGWPATRAQRLEDAVAELEPAIERRQVQAVGRQEPTVDPDVAGVGHPASTPPIAPSGPRALTTVSSHSAAGIALPGDPAADVERQAPAVGDERPDQDARLHRAVRPDPAERPGVRAAPDRLEALEDLHRPDLGGAGDRAARERGGEQVERVAPLVEPAGHRRHEMLDGCRPLEPAEARDADAPRATDTAEVVAQHVHDHHVLGAILGAGEQLTGERAILRPVAAARSGPLDRIGLDDAPRIDRQERLRRGREERPGPAGQLARPEVEVGREERRIAGPEAPVEVPRIAVERRLEPAGQVGLVDVAARRCARGRARRRPRRPLGRGRIRR